MSPLALALLAAGLWGSTDLVTTYVGRRIGSLRVVVIAVSTSLVLAGGVAITRGLLSQQLDLHCPAMACPLPSPSSLSRVVRSGKSDMNPFRNFPP